MTACLLTCLMMLSAGAQAQARIIPNVVYGHKDGMALIYDVFQPEQNANGAAIVYMVSGGWFSRWTEPENRLASFASMLAEGYTVIAVHHGSAGGHLSLMLGLDADDGMADSDDPIMQAGNGVAAVVAYFPPVDLRQMTGPNDRFPALDFPQELAAGISPLLLADRNDPPVLLIHGDADELVNISHSERMYSALQEAGVVSEFITIEGGAHGFRGDDAQEAAMARLEWFNQHLLD
ncbi:prolyl oligopeptidase family serine peptidase [Pseudohongiella sp. SYSU M77423]|mgnify:CR=1 FL=1|uniref:alpha/beta hydrolase family protein n=1 Tax=unclassified Pseudohongiella TaxID=2629611 RepID=UPI000C670A3F|nr:MULTISPECIES: prolyl oligopeptidase family serine peptidase [unclassified Pseudohongiella]MAY56842.1 peptidase S9 [Gammaproteobacteria bacterium]MBJ56533.1 peptidase S9 [Gammaproteobacteria bacterium]MDH7944658.1 prolyl oligopeptidase family serine peptidase [Pseudohongiella sp. SYSU M77423]|tara:strand:+ start:757 stop:1461 length:705 start_codon:yes stop_codon:yes gene_type:complete